MVSSIIVNLIGLSFILFIIWWFWLYREKKIVKVENLIEIKVKDGIYEPAALKARIGHPIILRFIREDATPCSEFVIFDQLQISKKLPLDQPTDIQLTLKKPGEYGFTCQMGMYKGKIIAD